MTFVDLLPLFLPTVLDRMKQVQPRVPPSFFGLTLVEVSAPFSPVKDLPPVNLLSPSNVLRLVSVLIPVNVVTPPPSPRLFLQTPSVYCTTSLFLLAPLQVLRSLALAVQEVGPLKVLVALSVVTPLHLMLVQVPFLASLPLSALSST